MLIEIARFWASIASYNPRLSRYEILGVMGPDEYHDRYPSADRPGLDNNTYTNVMAVWVIDRAMQTLDELPPYYRQEVVADLGLGADELARWRDITRKMRVVFHDDGVLTQFEGYERLQEFDWEGYRVRYGNIQRLDRLLEAEGDSTNRYKVSKQADVLMLLLLLSSGEIQAGSLARVALHPPGPGKRRRRQPGRDNRRGHPSGRHGRHGRYRAALPDRHAAQRPGARVRPGAGAARDQEPQLQRLPPGAPRRDSAHR